MTEKQVIERLVEIRKQNKITQKSLAKEIGITTANLSLLERGKTVLSVRRFLQICDILCVEPNKILEEEEHKPSTLQEIVMEMLNKLPPEEMELLVGVARLLSDRHDLRP